MTKGEQEMGSDDVQLGGLSNSTRQRKAKRKCKRHCRQMVWVGSGDGSPSTLNQLIKSEALTADPAPRLAVLCNATYWQKEVTAVATSLPEQVSRNRSRSRLAEGVPRPRSRMVAGQKLSESARMTRFPCGEDNRKNVGCTLKTGQLMPKAWSMGSFPSVDQKSTT